MTFDQILSVASVAAALSPDHNIVLLVPRLKMVPVASRHALRNLVIIGAEDVSGGESKQGLPDCHRAADLLNIKELYCYNVEPTDYAFVYLRTKLHLNSYSIYLHFYS